jgi:hypothetical protein
MLKLRQRLNMSQADMAMSRRFEISAIKGVGAKFLSFSGICSFSAHSNEGTEAQILGTIRPPTDRATLFVRHLLKVKFFDY